MALHEAVNLVVFFLLFALEGALNFVDQVRIIIVLSFVLLNLNGNEFVMCLNEEDMQ